jgi:hypothetical protein
MCRVFSNSFFAVLSVAVLCALAALREKKKNARKEPDA